MHPYISFWYNIEYVSNTFGYFIDDQIKLFFSQKRKNIINSDMAEVFIIQLMRFW
jgi:hypothetical protein